MVLSIIDCHCHFWDRGGEKHPLANHRMARYMPADLLADVAPIRLQGLVHVETGAEPSAPWRETERIRALLAETGLPFAIVGQADLLADDLTQTLKYHCAAGPVRGIRMRIVEDYRTLRRLRPGDNIYT